ncbi:MAG: NAD-dependent deacylase [Thermoanaerobaculia bacterium]
MSEIRDQRIVVFTGAGVSAESGLATFRSVGGLWADFDPATLATPEAFARDPKRVWDWYASRYVGVRDSEPNAAHRAIARLEAVFPSTLVVTQNIDRMHQRAGSRNLLELHGNIWNARCNACGKEVDMATAIDIADPANAAPRCGCGGRLRPAVVWFGERLPEGVFESAAEASAACDLFIAVGTSATVYPAAGLIDLAARNGAFVIEVNREETPLSHLADRVVREPAGEALPRLVEEWAKRLAEIDPTADDGVDPGAGIWRS